MEGTRRVDEWPRIREMIPSDSFIPVVQKRIEVEQEFDEAETTVVDSIDGKRTIAQLVLESRSSSFRVCSTLSPLVRGGFVRLIESVTDRDEAPVEAPFPAAGFSESDEITSMLTAAQNALRAKDYDKTQRLLKAAQNLDPNHPKVRSAIKGAEAVIMAELRNQGLHDSKIPKIIKSLEEITTMNFTPNEGFMLIGSLIKISPIREADALMIFYRLWKDGIVSL